MIERRRREAVIALIDRSRDVERNTSSAAKTQHLLPGRSLSKNKRLYRPIQRSTGIQATPPLLLTATAARQSRRRLRRVLESWFSVT